MTESQMPCILISAVRREFLNHEKGIIKTYGGMRRIIYEFSDDDLSETIMTAISTVHNNIMK